MPRLSLSDRSPEHRPLRSTSSSIFIMFSILVFAPVTRAQTRSTTSAAAPPLEVVIRPSNRPHRARLDITPPDLYCSVDGQAMARARDLGDVSTSTPHKLRCSASLDGGPFAEREIKASALEAAKAVLTIVDSIATIELRGADGAPIEDAALAARGPEGVVVGGFQPTNVLGSYAASITVAQPTPALALRVTVNGLAEVTTNAVPVAAPIGRGDGEIRRPRRLLAEIALMGSGTYLGSDRGGFAPQIAASFAIAIPDDAESATGSEAVFGVRVSYETFAFDAATAPGEPLHLPGGTALYAPGEASVAMRERAIGLGIPLALRLRTGGVKPYLSVVPTLFFEHAEGTSSLGGWDNGSSILPGVVGALGAQVRLGPVALFLEAGYRGVIAQTRAIGVVPLSGPHGTLGVALPL